MGHDSGGPSLYYTIFKEWIAAVYSEESESKTDTLPNTEGSSSLVVERLSLTESSGNMGLEKKPNGVFKTN